MYISIICTYKLPNAHPANARFFAGLGSKDHWQSGWKAMAALLPGSATHNSPGIGLRTVPEWPGQSLTLPVSSHVSGTAKIVWESELVMGHFSKPNPTENFWTQPNTTHKSLHPTQPNHHRHLIWHIRLYRKLQVIIQLQYSLTDSRVFHDVKNITQSSLHPTQPNPPKIKKKLWPNPTQPMDRPNPWPTLLGIVCCGAAHVYPRNGCVCVLNSLKNYASSIYHYFCFMLDVIKKSSIKLN